MKYSKPQLLILGDAVRSIQKNGNKEGTTIEALHVTAVPAYDLDE